MYNSIEAMETEAAVVSGSNTSTPNSKKSSPKTPDKGDGGGDSGHVSATTPVTLKAERQRIIEYRFESPVSDLEKKTDSINAFEQEINEVLFNKVSPSAQT